MNFKQLKEVTKKYNLRRYINVSLSVSLFDDKYLSDINIVRRYFIGRIFFKEERKLKYRVFKNIDYGRGVIKHLRYFEDKDTAAEYAWELFKDYVFNMLNDYYSEKWLERQKSLLEIIKTVEKEYN